MATLTTLAAVILVFVVLKPQSPANAPARAVALTNTGERVSTTIPITRIIARVAQAVPESHFRLIGTTREVVCTLCSAPSPAASQGGYNEEDEKDPIERMAA